MPIAARPTAEDVLEYLSLTQSNYPLEMVQEALDSATDQQNATCVCDPYMSALSEALKRRTARNLASRGALLGYLDLGPYGGPAALMRWDAQVESLESDFRLGGFC